MTAKKPHSSPSMEVVIVRQPFGKEFQNEASEAASWALAAAEGEVRVGFRDVVNGSPSSAVC